MTGYWRPTLGALPVSEGRCLFRVWAPRRRRVDLQIVAPRERVIPMKAAPLGYFELQIEDAPPGTRYFYRLDDEVDRPDPASRSQPDGVHGPSEIVDRQFAWSDQSWHGLPLERYILYELHVGTFTNEGTFDAVIPRLKELADLGVTAIELMPVAQFAGSRGWGYDGVYPFAPQNSYGGSAGLKRLVNACHAHGLAVVLDAVYNHFGPEGCYFQEFGHYFTDTYRTPWGRAVNLDGSHSDEVRACLIENALYWIHEFHIDALRLDAIHAIHDETAKPFLAELSRTVHRHAIDLNRHVHLIGESDLNDVRVVRPECQGGLGLDAQWADDFHHCLYTLLTTSENPYRRDYGTFELLVESYRQAFAYTGQYCPSRERRHGAPPGTEPGSNFVVFIQNHDQVGNCRCGERLGAVADFERQKLAAGTVLLSPYIPLLFMGEEYGETAPFQYFVDFSDANLIHAVREGRQREFAMYGNDHTLDPQAPETFLRSKLDPTLRFAGPHEALWKLHRTLLRLRKGTAALRIPDRERMRLLPLPDQQTLAVIRWDEASEVLVVMNFSEQTQEVHLPLRSGGWARRLDSADSEWLGPGSPTPHHLDVHEIANLSLSPTSIVVYERGSVHKYQQ
jgi:maltooligosyltrehalose trehalohydrolase